MERRLEERSSDHAGGVHAICELLALGLFEPDEVGWFEDALYLDSESDTWSGVNTVARERKRGEGYCTWMDLEPWVVRQKPWQTCTCAHSSFGVVRNELSN